MRIYAPWERQFNKISTPFENFLHAQTTTGLVLIFTTILALLIANSPLYESYHHFFHTKIELVVGEWKLSNSLTHWINDGLMAIFFFMIGLEIKREVIAGELSNIKVAILPILAAIGGMIIPALIYMIFNHDSQGADGWGIPMATDIAFAISALVLLGKRVSPSLITFLVALAIVDDLGAVIVIALFYTQEINILALELMFATLLILITFNLLGVRMILPYFIVGVVMWFFMLESGIHATIAGVLAALTIPTKPKHTPENFTKKTTKLLKKYDEYPSSSNYILHEEQKAILHNIQKSIDSIHSPAARVEHSLHLPVALIIIPLFALANAGIHIDFSEISSAISSPISLGIIFGLIAGKVLGIFGVSYLTIKLNIAKLPKDSSMSQLFGVAFLGGIGFTMSIFVADLAFLDDKDMIFQAKIGILTASLIAGLFGYFWLRFIAKSKNS
jgi:NhaA family Na+:H+ antiporter